jgi:hypothetical protein
VTIHSYRHRYSNAAGDPALEEIEKRLAAKPKIFTGPYQYRVLPKIGHNARQEASGIFADAILALAATA